MQIRTFTGPDPAAVLAEIKSTMGSDAVILASRDVRKGNLKFHEVTAGIERTITDNTLKAKAIATEIATPNQINELRQEWAALRNHILALMKPTMRLEQLTPKQRLALEYLQREGVEDDVIIFLYRRLLHSPISSILEPLSDIVEVKPLTTNNWAERVHVLVGPFGVGKTVTAVRMALGIKNEMPNAKICLINADCARGNGRLMLKHYAELAEVSYYEVSSAEDMSVVAKECRAMDRLIIDMPSLKKEQSIADSLSRIGIRINKVAMHLLLSAQYSTNQLREFLSAYKAEHAKSLIWTKLDESFNYGSIVNTTATSRLPISALSYSAELTNSMLPAQSIMLWRLLFKREMPNQNLNTL